MEAVLEARRRAAQKNEDAAAIAAGDAAAVSQETVCECCDNCVYQIRVSPALRDIFVSTALVVPPVPLLAARVALELAGLGFSVAEAGGELTVSFVPAPEIPLTASYPETPGYTAANAEFQRAYAAGKVYSDGISRLAALAAASPYATSYLFEVGSQVEEDFFFVRFSADGFTVVRATGGGFGLVVEIPAGFFA